MPKILHNRIRCNLCGDVIESYHRHDMKWCKCKSCAVDGGHDYLKRSFKGELGMKSYTELSESEPQDAEEAEEE